MKRFLLGLTALACVSAPLAAQDFPKTPPAIGAPRPFKLPASETYSLANGMLVTLVSHGVAPKTVVSLRVFAGNINDGEKTWLADLTADMLAEGAGGRPASQLATTAAGMGGDVSIAASTQSTAITMNVLSEFAPDAVALIGDVARRPDFPASEFDRVKANLDRRLAQALSQPGMLANAALARAYYGPSHPYGRLLPAKAQLASYTLADVKGFYAANYGAKRAHLYIAGRFDPAAVKAAVASAFDGWAAGPERLSLPPTPKQGPQIILINRPKAPQSTLRLAFPAPVAGSANDMQLRVANALLGGSFSSRITRNIREAKGYTYSPGSTIAFNPDVATWTFQADVTTANTGDSIREVLSEIRRLQTEVPVGDDASGSGTYLAGLFVIQNSTAPAIVNTLAMRDNLKLPPDWLDNYVPSALAVTPEQMVAAVKATLPIERMTLVVVGDLETVLPQLKALPELQDATFQTVTVP